MPVDVPLYPVNLVVHGRRCLVVGGGRIAARKAEALAACGARVHVVATAVGPDIQAIDGVTWEERPYSAADVVDCRLVITATDDPAVNRAVFDDAEAAGIWANSADDPVNCSFTLPAVVRRGPITVAVGTGGHSPALSGWLKERFASEIGPEFEVLVDLLSEARDEIRDAGGSTEDLDWKTAIDSGMLDLIRAGQVTAARERLQTCLSSSSA